MATDRIERLPAFQPAHPGEILREDVLPGLDLPRAKLAEHLGVSTVRPSTTSSTKSGR